MMILLIATLVVFIWFLGALSKPLGYQISAAEAKRTISHIQLDVIEENITGSTQVSLNLFFFPISSLCGIRTMAKDFENHVQYYIPGKGIEVKQFKWETGHQPYTDLLAYPQQVAEGLVGGQIYLEVPFFFFLGLIVGTLLDQLLRLRSHRNAKL
jgi:hypothetical protein